MVRLRMALLAGTVAALAGIASAESPYPTLSAGSDPVANGTVSVMTYNVEGLPWPVQFGRSGPLEKIGETLRHMREEGRNPHVVVLQEAFSSDAQEIGRIAGYRYRVSGMSSDGGSLAAASATDRAFLAQGRWSKGEGMGKFVGSGLEILSDYPIVSTRRMAYPDFACAGFDCLANKGAVMASIAVPGAATPIDIVTTHLNSKHASGVDDARSFYAYRLQTAFLSDFIRTAHDSTRPLIVAGDFNVSAPQRRAALLDQVAQRWTAAGPFKDALHAAVAQRITLSADANRAMTHGRDWQFYAPGARNSLQLGGIEVPFGHAADGTMLSDHIGYTAVYHLKPATSGGQPTA